MTRSTHTLLTADASLDEIVKAFVLMTGRQPTLEEIEEAKAVMNSAPGLTDVHYGPVNDGKRSVVLDETLDDDEEHEPTSQRVIDILGFDPMKEDYPPAKKKRKRR